MRCPTAAPRPLAWATLALWAAGAGLAAPLPVAAAAPQTADGLVTGRIEGDAGVGFRHLPPEGDAAIPIDRVRQIEYPQPREAPAEQSPTFRVRLADGGLLSGWLESIDASHLTLKVSDTQSLRIERSGLSGLDRLQTLVPVFRDRFESIDRTRWQTEGDVHIDADDPNKPAPLTLLGPGSALRLRPLDTPVHTGRLTIAYRDDALPIDALRWSIELRFERPGTESATLRIVPGWQEPNLAVEATPGGPSLHVRPIPRSPGPHTLVVYFDKQTTILTVDGRELAHGEPIGESLSGLALSIDSARAADRTPPPVEINAISLERSPARPATGPIEPTLDAVTRNPGDQLYGRVIDAGSAGLRLSLDPETPPVALPWAEIASVEARRVPSRPSAPLAGLWVRVAWSATDADNPGGLDRAEGVLIRADAAGLTFDVPYVGHIGISEARLRTVELLGRSRRWLIDPHPHHLGDRNVPDLDPPDAEGDTFERRFTLDSLPAGPAELVVDTVRLIGLNGTPTYSELVRRGELRTRVRLNDVSLPDLNTVLTLPNDAVIRLRLPIPPDTLRVGENLLRFEQNGSADDPDQRDDFGFRKLALEWPVPDDAP